MNKNIIIGGVAGGLVGVATALLLAPKPGSQLIKDVYKPLAPVIRNVFSHVKKAHHKGAKQASLHSSPSKVKGEGQAAHKTAAKGISKAKKERAVVAKKGASVKRVVAKRAHSATQPHVHPQIHEATT